MPNQKNQNLVGHQFYLFLTLKKLLQVEICQLNLKKMHQN